MGPRIPKQPRPPTAEEMDRRILRRRKFGASGEEHPIPAAYSREHIVPSAAEAHISMNDIIASVGAGNYQHLEKMLGSTGITRLAAKLRTKIPLSEWGDRWDEVAHEAFGRELAGQEKPAPPAVPKKPAPVAIPAKIHKREPIELQDLRRIAKGHEVDGLVAALGAEETAKLLNLLKTRGRGPSIVVSAHIEGITKLAKAGMNAKTILMMQDLWRAK